MEQFGYIPKVSNSNTARDSLASDRPRPAIQTNLQSPTSGAVHQQNRQTTDQRRAQSAANFDITQAQSYGVAPVFSPIHELIEAANAATEDLVEGQDHEAAQGQTAASYEDWCPDCCAFDGTHDPYCGDTSVQDYLDATAGDEFSFNNAEVLENISILTPLADDDQASSHLSTAYANETPPSAYTRSFPSSVAAQRFLQTGHRTIDRGTDNPTTHYHAARIMDACLFPCPEDQAWILIEEAFRWRPLVVEANVFLAATAMMAHIAQQPQEHSGLGDGKDRPPLHWETAMLDFDKQLALEIVTGNVDVEKWIAEAVKIRKGI